MKTYDNKKIQMFSTIGSRATFGIVAYDLAKDVENLMILTADVSTSAGLDRYRKKYSEKYFDMNIFDEGKSA